MSKTLTDANIIQRLILSLKFNSEILKTAILERLSKKKEAQKLKFFASDNWFGFQSTNKQNAASFLDELCAKIQP
jgi:hypothetical protein